MALPTDLKISEEGEYQEIHDNKWSEDGVKNPHEDESSLESKNGI